MNSAKVSELTQISPRMLRYYEEQGLIKPRRTISNYRIYSEQDIQNIKKIKLLNEAGVALNAICVLLPCFDLDNQSFTLCPIVKMQLEHEIEKISKHLEHLTQSHTLLISFLNKGSTDLD